MAKFFQINMPQDYTEWMELISSSELYSQRAKELKEYSEAINEALSKYDKHKEVESLLDETKAKQTEALAERVKARDYAQWKRAEAEKSFAETMAQGAKNLEEIDKQGHLLTERETRCAYWEADLKEREAAFTAVKAAVEKREKAAETKTHAAEKVKSELQAKLKKLKEAVE
jgi:hypothetical protein